MLSSWAHSCGSPIQTPSTGTGGSPCDEIRRVGQLRARAVDENGRIERCVQGPGGGVSGRVQRMQDGLNERVWTVALRIVVGAGDQVERIAAGLEHQVLMPDMVCHSDWRDHVVQTPKEGCGEPGRGERS